MNTEKTFIKILDPDIAKILSDKGFAYIKEQNIYCFLYDENLLALLQTEFASNSIVIENTLTF